MGGLMEFVNEVRTFISGEKGIRFQADVNGRLLVRDGSNSVDTLYSGNTALTVKFKTIVASSSGVTELVALVATKKIRVLSYVLTANAAVNAKFQSHTVPTDLTGLLYMAANGGVSAPFNPKGWFETVAGEALDINLSGAVAVGGHLTYVEV